MGLNGGMSQTSSAADELWFVRALEGKVEISGEAAGEIEVVSGSLVVSDHHGLSRAKALDAEVPVGRWLITRFAEGSLFGGGDLGVLLAHVDSVPASECAWSRATVQGRPARAAEVVGDGDTSLLLGTGPFVANYPMMLFAEGATDAQVAEMRAMRAVPSNPKLLLPGASVAAFSMERLDLRLPWYVRGGGTGVWLGRDAAGEVRCVFVDWLSDFLHRQDLPMCDDVWQYPLPGATAAQLLVDVDSLEGEPGDVEALFDSVPEPGVRVLDEVDMRGQLRLVPGRGAWQANPAETPELIESGEALPLRVSGPVAVFTRETSLSGEFITLLRFGDQKPTRWAYLQPFAGRKYDVLTTDEVVRRGPEDQATRWAFADVSDRGFTNKIDRFPAVNWWPAEDGYNMLVGLGDDGRVHDLAVFDNRETATYTVRSPDLDEALLARLRASGSDDPDYDEYLDIFESSLAEAGEVTRELRGELHWLIDRFVDTVD